MSPTTEPIAFAVNAAVINHFCDLGELCHPLMQVIDGVEGNAMGKQISEAVVKTPRNSTAADNAEHLGIVSVSFSEWIVD